MKSGSRIRRNRHAAELGEAANGNCGQAVLQTFQQPFNSRETPAHGPYNLSAMNQIYRPMWYLIAVPTVSVDRRDSMNVPLSLLTCPR